MAAKQVKSKKRVTDHGEVFTAEREVKAMCDLVADECLRIDSRFLEPACGDGNFLAEILSRKLDVVTRRYKKSSYDYERNALLALGSLYGVELLQDNATACRSRLFSLWNERYEKAVKKKDRNGDVLESARYILEKNIICGNALTLHEVNEFGEDTGVPIVFSQWAFATGPMIKREDYTFEELLHQNDASSKTREPEQMTLDQITDKEQPVDEGTLIKIYPPIHYRRLKEYG
ncbi:MAG: hypothetical protein K6G34_09395 [Lachnospiraceae bacterium]|nr:hypothetical protein [Lachnospiraceae bacterium]